MKCPHLIAASALWISTLGGPFAQGQTSGTVDALDVAIEGDYVQAMAIQPDGKLIIGGSFTSIQGVPRQHLARLNADGTLDTGFEVSPNNWVLGLSVQPDGKILVWGFFTEIQHQGDSSPTERSHIARLNQDGSIDGSFDPKADDYVFSVAIQNDGSIILCGRFTSLQPNGAPTPVSRKHIARVDEDGFLDASYNPNPNNWVRCLVPQGDGKVLIGGDFTSLQPNGTGGTISRRRIARLHPDGTVDSGFDPNANGVVWAIAQEPDGDILLGGGFTTLQPNGAPTSVERRRLARVDSDGELDAGFEPSVDQTVRNIVVLTDGRILVGGHFTLFRPTVSGIPAIHDHMVGLNSDGSVDPIFDFHANDLVYNLAVQADGKVWTGGPFTGVRAQNSTSSLVRGAVARLNNGEASQELVIPNTSRIEWRRSGSGPEAYQATFDQSIDDGTTWTRLGNGSRIGTTSDWEINGLSLPNGCLVRARGRIIGGVYTSLSGIIETVTTFSTDPVPMIAVEEPPGTGLVDGETQIDFGLVQVGGSSMARTFIIRNLGTGDLTNLAISKDGVHPGDFIVSAPSSTTVSAGGGTATIIVIFNPSASQTGVRRAQIHITSNVAGSQNPFSIGLSGLLLFPLQDSDFDGMNDGAEIQLAAFGFDWTATQTALVDAYYDHASSAGLFTANQIQALNVGTPLIQRDPLSGAFTLTIGVEKSGNLIDFDPFPMTAPQTLLNGDGKLEFEFSVPDDTAFFQLHAE